MTHLNSLPQIQSAFVTGATGLLGNNLVRLLVSRGVHVKALSRSRTRAERQFGDLPIEIVTGDMAKVGEFAAHLQGNDVVFHTAAFFRDGYKGGRHWKEFYEANVRGTAELFEMWACMVLPGWMVGPGDAGPTSSGQVILDA